MFIKDDTTNFFDDIYHHIEETLLRDHFKGQKFIDFYRS